MALGETDRLIVGRYRVDRELRRGPHAQSFLVTDLRSGRPCVLRQVFVATSSPAELRCFEAQAAVLAKLDHPGLPRFIDGFTEGDGEGRARVIVASYHPGESLERLVAKDRSLTESQALNLLRRLVPVLVYLHAFEPPLVHRTIKTAGIIIGPDGRPCLTDLNYALAEIETPSEEQAPPGPDQLSLAAPEVFMGAPLPASDIYALGLAVVRGMIAVDPAVLLREGARLRLREILGVSEAFAAVLARMLDPSLERRYAAACDLDADLAQLAGVQGIPEGQPAPRVSDAPRVRARKVLFLVIAGAIPLLLLVALVMRLFGPPAPEVSLLVPTTTQEQAAAPVPPADTGTATEPAPSPSPAPEPALVAVTSALVPSSEPASLPARESGARDTPVNTAPVHPPVPAPEHPPSDVAPAVVEGRLRLDGKLFAGTAAADPRFWFRNEGTQTVETPQVIHKAGVFTVHDLAPGRYGVSVRINANTANPDRFPGDLDGWAQFTVEESRPASFTVPLRRIIRLLQPVDTNGVIPGWEAPCGSGNVHPGRILFAWEPLPGAANYHVRIDRLACGRGDAPVGTVFSRSTNDPWVKVELPSSGKGECYSFGLTARTDAVPSGILTTHGRAGSGRDYRFTVSEH